MQGPAKSLPAIVTFRSNFNRAKLLTLPDTFVSQKAILSSSSQLRQSEYTPILTGVLR